MGIGLSEWILRILGWRMRVRRRIVGVTFKSTKTDSIHLLQSEMFSRIPKAVETNIVCANYDLRDDMVVGSNTASDVLIIQAGGRLFDLYGFIGNESTSDSVLVAGGPRFE